jgi:ParB family chromosome partitioning protein
VSTRKRGLGRGLDVLLGDNKISNGESLQILSTEKLQPGSSQPRGKIELESIRGLSKSIKSQGLMQPILVRKESNGKFDIIAGERRWRAAKLAGLKEVPVVIKDVNDSSALAMALVENLQREDLNPIEEAKGVSKLINEFGLTHSEAADSLGKSRASVTNLLRLLNAEKAVQNLLLNGKLEQGHVRALLSLKKTDQIALASLIVSSNMSVRQTEYKVKRLLNIENKPTKETGSLMGDYDELNLEQEISDLLNLPVKIKMEGKSKGKLMITFSMIDELEGFLKKIQFNK